MSSNKHNYIPLYETAASMIPQGSKVIELGCGDGQFADMVAYKCDSYTAIDWDISEARLIRSAAINVVEADINDLTWEDMGLTFVALEVLEHIENDLDIIFKMPKGSRVIISVPSFDSSGHRRFFPAEYEGLMHFGDVLEIDLWRKIRMPIGGGYFHLMRGYR